MPDRPTSVSTWRSAHPPSSSHLYRSTAHGYEGDGAPASPDETIEITIVKHKGDDRPSLSAGADPSDVESDGAFADRDGARRFRQNASPGMASPEGDFALSPAASDGMSDRLGPAARQRFERMQKAASAQRRDGETDAMALSRWISDTPRGRRRMRKIVMPR